MIHWKVRLAEEAESEMLSLIEKKLLTKADIKVLLRWVNEMEEFGPKYIASSSEWHDHELKREWQGFRSSAFSHSGRVIYKIFEDEIIVKVFRVTSNHNYKL